MENKGNNYNSFSGAKGTDEEVLYKLRTHENNETRPVEIEKQESKNVKFKKIKQAVLGPSYYHQTLTALFMTMMMRQS